MGWQRGAGVEAARCTVLGLVWQGVCGCCRGKLLVLAQPSHAGVQDASRHVGCPVPHPRQDPRGRGTGADSVHRAMGPRAGCLDPGSLSVLVCEMGGWLALPQGQTVWLSLGSGHQQGCELRAGVPGRSQGGCSQQQVLPGTRAPWGLPLLSIPELREGRAPSMLGRERPRVKGDCPLGAACPWRVPVSTVLTPLRAVGWGGYGEG